MAFTAIRYRERYWGRWDDSRAECAREMRVRVNVNNSKMCWHLRICTAESRRLSRGKEYIPRCNRTALSVLRPSFSGVVRLSLRTQLNQIESCQWLRASLYTSRWQHTTCSLHFLPHVMQCFSTHDSVYIALSHKLMTREPRWWSQRIWHWSA
jgi:hypothetical protein